MTREPRVLAARMAVVGLAGILVGCTGKISQLSDRVAPNATVGKVTLSPHNAVIVVGGTLPLQLTALTLAGDPLTQSDSVIYRLDNATDSVRATVSATGAVTGVRATGSAPVAVNAFVFWGNGIRADQMLVQVTPAVVSGVTLSIQPSGADSAKLASGTAKTITPIVRNTATGASIGNVQLQYDVTDADWTRVAVYRKAIRFDAVSNAVQVRLQRFTPNLTFNQIYPMTGEGNAWIYAELSAYGTLLKDSVRYTFSYPYAGTVAVSKSNLEIRAATNGGTALGPALTGTTTLAPGATIIFSNNLAATDPLGVTFTFDNPAAATAASPASTTSGAAGNITTLTGGQNSRRQFLTAGTYRWTATGVSGPAPWNGQVLTGVITIR